MADQDRGRRRDLFGARCMQVGEQDELAEHESSHQTFSCLPSAVHKD
jgi:hypothetical protein